MDSPATTSAVTYKIQGLRHSGSANVAFHHNSSGGHAGGSGVRNTATLNYINGGISIMSELRTNKIIPRDGLVSGANGGIVQVVHAATDTHFTSTSTTPKTIVSASITPTSASNKILIQYTAEHI